MAVLVDTDFFTVEVLTWRGLTTYYVLFLIHLESRLVNPPGENLGRTKRRPDSTATQINITP
jgi:hypothetical protein